MNTHLPAYQAALHAVAYFEQASAGFLRLSGADRLDFIQRQSTNDLRQLKSDQVLLTVLTSPTARILDVLCLIDEGEALGVIPLPGRSEQTAQFLRSRIFFNDQVTLTDASSDYGHIWLVGPQAAAALESLALRPPELNRQTKTEVDGQLVIVMARSFLGARNYQLLVPKPVLNSVLAVLAQAGAPPLSAETFEILRVECGDPWPSGELVSDYTPLEIGLQSMISSSKGCYTGQEVIARQITYDKVTKSLVGLKVAESAQVGDAILANEKTIGKLTSVAQSPRFGSIALGVIRQASGQEGADVKILSASGAITPACLVDLPFE